MVSWSSSKFASTMSLAKVFLFVQASHCGEGFSKTIPFLYFHHSAAYLLPPCIAGRLNILWQAYSFFLILPKNWLPLIIANQGFPLFPYTSISLFQGFQNKFYSNEGVFICFSLHRSTKHAPAQSLVLPPYFGMWQNQFVYHMFSNLKGVGTPTTLSQSKRIGQLFDLSLGRIQGETLSNRVSHSVKTRNPPSFVIDWLLPPLTEVNSSPAIQTSISALISTKDEKLFMFYSVPSPLFSPNEI